MLALALALASRAGVASAVGAPRALSRQAAVVPAWIGIAIVASIRAGSSDLGAMRGAHAVAGLGVLAGDVVTVAALWFATVAGALAIAYGGMRVGEPPLGRLDMVGIALQGLLLVTMAAGPHVSGAVDLVPWVVASVVLGAIVVALGRIAWMDRAGTAASGLAAVALVLALMGDPL